MHGQTQIKSNQTAYHSKIQKSFQKRDVILYNYSDLLVIRNPLTPTILGQL